MNIIEMQNLIVTSTRKKGYFKLTGKNKSVDVFKIPQSDTAMVAWW